MNKCLHVAALAAVLALGAYGAALAQGGGGVAGVEAAVAVEPVGVPEVVRPEPEAVPAARARPVRARAAVARVRRERDRQHQKARQAIHNAAPERPARESAILVLAIPIDQTGAEPDHR
jgi:hypothetical protein